MVKNYMNMVKKYKEKTPEETIQYIRKILFELGLLLREDQREFNGLNSCRVIIENNNLYKLDIGTNGKGRSYSYSLASGYAEFMERLQNYILYNRDFINVSINFTNTLHQDSLYIKKVKHVGITNHFVFDAKEKITKIDDVLKVWEEELCKMYNIEKHNQLYELLIKKLNIEYTRLVPCYSVNKDKKVLLPLELFLVAKGSNGMCAGNSDIECVLQGLCEIFERYSIQQIYYQKLTPPTIPIDKFKGTFAYNMIQKIIEKTNYKIIVKDCSLGKNLPVIGIIIIDENNMIYNFKLGSDFSPHIALERCLTELYQSSCGFKGVTMNFSWEQNEQGQDISDEEIDRNFEDIISTSSGFWPISIFSSNFSYEFNNFVSNGSSNKEDLKIGLALVENLGFDTYLRNNSYLGFSTYDIIIPGMSQTIRTKDKVEERMKLNQNFHYLLKLGRLNTDETISLITALEKAFNVGYIDRFNYTRFYLFNTDNDLLNLDLYLLLSMLYYSISDYSNSKLYIDNFLEDKDQNSRYYFAISDYLNFYRISNFNTNETFIILSKLYGKLIAQEVIDDMRNPKAVFNDYLLPNCFQCEKCKVQKTCNLFFILKLENNLKNAQIKANIKHSDIPYQLKLK